MICVNVFCSFRHVLSPWSVVEATPQARLKTTPIARIVVEVCFADSFHIWALLDHLGWWRGLVGQCFCNVCLLNALPVSMLRQVIMSRRGGPWGTGHGYTSTQVPRSSIGHEGVTASISSRYQNHRKIIGNHRKYLLID